MTKILLVEDDKSLREIYGVRLLAEGYDIVSAGDGEEALAMAIKDRPSLIISDVMMPKISGFDMLDILRSTTETKDIKVIMMTALSSEDQRARGEQLGADYYLVKSQVGIEDVVRTVHQILGDAASAPATPAPTAAAPSAPTPAAPAVPPRPATTPAPQPAATPPAASTPQPPAVPANPFVTPQTAAAPTPPTPQLPQPTAPFSTAKPAGFGVGDRVINPLPKDPAAASTDFSAMIDMELSDMPPLKPTTPPAPTAPAQPAAPSTPPQPPTQPIPTPPETSAGVNFEETPPAVL